MTHEQLFEVFRVVTRARAIPRADVRHMGNDYAYVIPNDPKLQQIAGLFRHMFGNIMKKVPDWQLDWIWQGHRHEFPNVFDKATIKEDIKTAAKAAKWKPEDE